MDHWNIQRTTFTVAYFLSWMKNGELELSPSFQRRPVWKPKAKSYLIDTIVRGLPVPIIFVRDRIDIRNTRSMKEIVDGQQRLRTVISYINPAILNDFNINQDRFSILRSHNKDLAGLDFHQLPSEVREHMLGYQFSVDILPRSASDADVLQIFKRMNSTGQKLTPQELRNAEFTGYYAQSIYDMALEQLDRWRRWKIFNETEIARMEEVEFASEVYILMKQGIFAKNKGIIDRFYSINEQIPDDLLNSKMNELHILENRFRLVFDRIDDAIGKELPSLTLRRKAIFFNLVSFFYELLYGIRSELRPDVRPNKLPENIMSKLVEIDAALRQLPDTDKVAQAISRRTTHLSSRKAVINYMLRSIGREQLA
jgi:hypothetical protein